MPGHSHKLVRQFLLTRVHLTRSGKLSRVKIAHVTSQGSRPTKSTAAAALSSSMRVGMGASWLAWAVRLRCGVMLMEASVICSWCRLHIIVSLTRSRSLSLRWTPWEKGKRAKENNTPPINKTILFVDLYFILPLGIMRIIATLELPPLNRN